MIHKADKNRFKRRICIERIIASFMPKERMEKYIKSRFDENDSKMDRDNRVESIKNDVNLKLDMQDK